MNVTRRDIGRLATTSILVYALPMGQVLAKKGPPEAPSDAPPGASPALTEGLVDAGNAEVELGSKEKGKMNAKVSAKKQHKGATTTNHLSDGFDNVHFGIYSRRDPHGWTPLPRDGKLAVLIDFKGNWEFSGGFPPQQMYYPCATAVGIGLKSSLGQTIAFLAHGDVPATSEGWSFSKHGHAAVVADLWKDVVKGHEFHGSWSTKQVVPQSQGGGSNGSDASSVVSDVTKGLIAVLGVLAAIF
jgi:hypothetical protein